MVNPLLVLLIIVAFGTAIFMLQRVASARLDRSMRTFQDQLADMARESNTLLARLPPSVFFKPIGDEAALALAWTSAMAALMQAASTLLFLASQKLRDAWTGVPLILRISCGVMLSAAWCWGTALLLTALSFESLSGAVRNVLDFERTDFDFWFSWFSAFSVMWTLLAWVILLLVALAIFAVISVALLAAAGAGTASLQAALFLRISVEAIPMGSQRLVLVDVSPLSSVEGSRLQRSKLSHSALYNSPGAIDAVVDALEGFEAGRNPTSGKSHVAPSRSL